MASTSALRRLVRGRGGAFLAGAGLVLAAAIATPASGALSAVAPGSWAAPSLAVSPLVFTLGASIDAAGPYDPSENCSGFQSDKGVPLTLAWTASPGRGTIASFAVSRYDSYRDPSPVTTVSGSVRSIPIGSTNYESDCGGQSGSYTFGVTASTYTGPSPLSDLARAWSPLASLLVYQEDGRGPNRPDPVLHVTEKGTWSTARCTCFDWAATRYTTAKGASRSFPVTTSNRLQDVALVAPTGPDRGSFTVSVDGGATRTVSTYGKDAVNRVVVWHQLVSPGRHSVVVTNLATPGRPRIDVDAVMWTTGYYGPCC